MNDCSAKTRLLTVKTSLFLTSHLTHQDHHLMKEKWNHLAAPTPHNNTRNNSSPISFRICETPSLFDDHFNDDDFIYSFDF